MKTNREKQADYRKRMIERGFRFVTVMVLESSIKEVKEIEKRDREAAK